jgi:hypothetical protein
MAKAKKSVPADDVYVLKVVGQNGEAHRGFVWPLTVGATVTAPDWQPHRECGNGLHGWLWGEGDVSASGDRHADPASKWLVLRVAKASIVELDRKVKFPSCVVEFVGLREAAVSRMAELAGAGRQIVYGTSTSGHHGTSTSGDGGTSTSGDGGTSTSGYGGTSTSGDGGTSTSGDGGTSTSGYGGTSTSGDGGTSTSGDGGTSTSGHHGTSTSGHHGTSTSGECGTSTSGHHGTSTSGHHGTSTSGDGGTSTSGHHGTSTSGECGILVIRWWDEEAEPARYRLAVGYVGEGGIRPNAKYKVVGRGVITEVV